MISKKRKNYDEEQIGSFLHFQFFEYAKKLLSAQVGFRNRAYRCLQFKFFKKRYRYAKLERDYFEEKIANNLFYCLEDEFFFYDYKEPKGLLGIRNQKLFSLPLLLTYYAIGIYLRMVSEGILNYFLKNRTRINSYSGGSLEFKDGEIITRFNVLHYKKYYKQFTKKLKFAAKPDGITKTIFQLDIENYFDNINIKILLDFIEDFAKPIHKKERLYDRSSTKECLQFFFGYLMKGGRGIPQSNHNIISLFLGDLYLKKFDIFVDKYFRKNGIDYRYVRYIDDIRIIINKNVNKIGQIKILREFEEFLFSELRLRLNMKKSKISQVFDKATYNIFLRDIKRVSSEFDYNIENEESLPAIKKADEFMKTLYEIKGISQEQTADIFNLIPNEKKDKLKLIFDENVLNCIIKNFNDEVVEYFQDFNFELINLNLYAFISLLTAFEPTKKMLVDYLEKCKDSSLYTFSILEALLVDNESIVFNNTKLSELVSQNGILSTIFSSQIIFELKSKKCKLTQHSIEQLKYMIFCEFTNNFPSALNHLANFVQQFCYDLDQSKPDRCNYKANRVKEYLINQGICSSDVMQIINLFDRRNNNTVSHSGIGKTRSWAVEKKEYYKYKSVVLSIIKILSDFY